MENEKIKGKKEKPIKVGFLLSYHFLKGEKIDYDLPLAKNENFID